MTEEELIKRLEQAATGRTMVDDRGHVADGYHPMQIAGAAAEMFSRVVDERDELRDRLGDICQWCEAYPLDIFPEPDLHKARQLLEAGGITLDAVSASAMRHVLKGVLKIINKE